MNGFSLTMDVPENEREQLSAELWEAGTIGITEDEHWLRAFFTKDADAGSLMQRWARLKPILDYQDDYDWVAHSQSLWKPFAVGERFWLSPEWLDDEAPEGRLRLKIRPGLACGSGWHPATRLCLEGLERTILGQARVLDVGTGSGLLAEAATLLGARWVGGCDVDHAATLIARRNVPDLPLFTGSLDSVGDAAVDVVVANLDAPTLDAIGSQLARVARSTFIVSGFPEHEADRVQSRLGRPVQTILELEGWICIIC